MSKKMTSRDRLTAAVAGRDVDYVPCWAGFNPMETPQRVGHTWNFPWTLESTYRQQLEYQVRGLGLDQAVWLGGRAYKPTDGVTSRAWLEGDVLHKAYTTPAGVLHASVRYNEQWAYGKDILLFSDYNVGHFIEPWIRNEQDLECLKHVMRLDDSVAAIEGVRSQNAAGRQLADEFGLATMAYCGMGLTGAQHLFGVAPLCMMVMDNPGLVDAYLEHEHAINVRQLESLAAGGTQIIRRNGFYETADFYGPAMLEQFLGKRLRREAEVARSLGMLTSYTVHSGVMPILDYLASLTFDSFFGIDTAFRDVDLRTIKRKIAPAKSVWTGPSSTFHLWKGPDATRKAVRDVFEIWGKRGLILSPCVSAHCIMPWESTLAMIDEWKKLR